MRTKFSLFLFAFSAFFAVNLPAQNPAKPALQVNRLAPAPGQTNILLDGGVQFSTDTLKSNFITYLGLGGGGGTSYTFSTGLTLTGSTLTVNAINLAGTGSGGITGTLPASHGGTGLTSFAAGTNYLAPAAIGSTVQAYNANTTTLGNTATGTGAVVLSASPTVTGLDLTDPEVFSVANIAYPNGMFLFDASNFLYDSNGSSFMQPRPADNSSSFFINGAIYDGTPSDARPGTPGQVLTSVSIGGLEYVQWTTPRITPRSGSIAYAGTVTPDSDNYDVLDVGTLTGALTISNDTGTPTDGQTLTIRFVENGTGGYAISWGTVYAFGTDITPSLIPTAANSKWKMRFVWDSTDSKWWAVGIVRGF